MSATMRLDPVFVLALALVNGFIVTLPWFGVSHSYAQLLLTLT
jgi:hypothetical protein